MSLAFVAAILFAVLALATALFQFIVALGAPWGHLTMGGRFEGRLPVPWRAAAVLQGGLLIAMERVVTGAAGLFEPLFPPWAIWVVVALMGLSTLANNATPSRPERLLWGPVTVVMFLCAIYVAVAG